MTVTEEGSKELIANERRWADRFRAFADSIDGHSAALEDEVEARDRAIVEAIDLGWHRAKVAAWCRISKGRVTQIIAARCAE